MVLAGPGSGKTSVIVERTAYMINEGKIPASSILVVTFSRAAATEMKERFLKFVGQNRSEVTFGTFHGIFYGILKAAYHLSAANILSEEEKFSILREMTEKYGQEMAQEGDFIEEVAREISVVKGNCISPEHYYASCCSDEIFRDIFHGYKQALKAKRKLDFDDMILCCYELFSQRQDILNAWRRKFVYILVDEFQDINSLQYKILQMLAAPSAMPSRMDTGMLTKSITLAWPPCAMLVKVENSTMTKISSQDAPAMISCGMLFSVP